jgi:hypothetical protein
MKSLHRPDLFSWSVFDLDRNIDFNSIAWLHPSGTILIDPLTMATHDLAHLISLGTVTWIVITNSDHIRASQALSHVTGAKIAAPLAEKETFPIRCHRWLADGEEIVPGLQALALKGSKTRGELALLLDETTLITGDLIRAHRAGSLMILPDDKLHNKTEAIASIQRLSAISSIETVLVGDGWSIFQDGHHHLQTLAASL